MHRPLAIALLSLATTVGCGGPGATGAPAGAASPQPTQAPASAAQPTPTAAPTVAPTQEAASLAPGSIAYRVVNLSGGNVDVWIRSDGLVRAQQVLKDLPTGQASDDLFPPDPGTVVVLPAGGTNPTCVSGCSFLAESSTAWGEGDRRLLVVRTDGATELWEHSASTSANALPPDDPATALLIGQAQAVVDGSFGMRLALDGGTGCLADREGAQTLLGGTVVVAYPVDAGEVRVAVHGGADADCSKPPLGGPFPVSTILGSRSMLLLGGSMNALSGVAIPLR